jgi:hypothetical protein
MKKNSLFTYVIAMIAFFMMASCGNGGSKPSEESSDTEISSNSSKLSDEELRHLIYKDDFRKACELKEYLTAYKIVDKFNDEASRFKANMEKYRALAERDKGWTNYYSEAKARYEESLKKYIDTKKYVVLQESLFVLESEGVNGLMRIVGIAKEHDSEDWLYTELLDVAKKIGDSDLTERLQNMINLESSKDQKVKK